MKEITSKPTLINVVEALRESILSDINCHAMGKILAFDSSDQTATIEIQYQRRVEGLEATYERLDYPTLVGVPVIITGGGSGSLRFPVKEGDYCVILFNDRDIDNFITTGSKTPLSSDRKHSLSDAVAIVGLRPLSTPLLSYDTDRTELVHADTKISLESKIRIKNQVANLFDIVDGLFTQLGALVPTTGIPAANKAAIAALQVQFQQLMEH